ncbi:MAG TPA: V-type ATP synthase subunit F [Caldisericia bacterium]|nr:V-type ATP synthase subunit F [Caldisericia bacterium]
MKKIKACVLGERDFIRIFGAYSFEVFPVQDAQSFNQKLHELLKEALYDIYIITETYIVQLNKENTSLVQELKPVILSIPSNQGSTSTARNTLSDLIRKAVGIDLLSSEKGAV